VTVLCAIGFDYWLKNAKEISLSKLKPVLLMPLAFLFIWIFVFLEKSPNFDIAERNAILPTVICIITLIVLFASTLKIFSKFRKVFAILLILVASVVYSYFFNKSSPFAPAKFAFPNHRVFNFLSTKAEENRFYGFGSAHVDNNFATYYKVYATEGYDSLYIRSYGELLASSKDGRLEKNVLRSDAVIPSEDSFSRNRLLDILGVKYILDKDDAPKSNWEFDPLKFPVDRYELVWQSFKWKAFQRKTVLPRTFLIGDYEVLSNDKLII
jgi:hypothetical protein